MKFEEKIRAMLSSTTFQNSLIREYRGYFAPIEITGDVTLFINQFTNPTIENILWVWQFLPEQYGAIVACKRIIEGQKRLILISCNLPEDETTMATFMHMANKTLFPQAYDRGFRGMIIKSFTLEKALLSSEKETNFLSMLIRLISSDDLKVCHDSIYPSVSLPQDDAAQAATLAKLAAPSAMPRVDVAINSDATVFFSKGSAFLFGKLWGDLFLLNFSKAVHVRRKVLHYLRTY